MRKLLLTFIPLETVSEQIAEQTFWDKITFPGMSFLGTYLVLCIISYPIILLILFLLARYTNLFEKLNRWLDKKTQKKGKTTASDGKKPEEEKDGNPKEKDKTPTEDDDDIARFRLYVGNGYKCRLPNEDPGILQNNKWVSENEFVGGFLKGKNSNLFSAKKVGTSCLLFNDRTYYELHVLPNNPAWIADKHFNMLLAGQNIELLKMDMATAQRKIIRNDFQKGNYIYEGKGRIKMFSFSGDMENQRIKRFVYELSFDENELKQFVTDLEERMSPLKKYNEEGKEIPETDINLWYHESLKKVNGKFVPKVDLIAFMKKLRNGNWCVGIGRAWRLYAERVEVQDNRNMILKSFYALLPEELQKEVEENDKKFALKNEAEEEQERANIQAETTDNQKQDKEEETVSDSIPEPVEENNPDTENKDTEQEANDIEQDMNIDITVEDESTEEGDDESFDDDQIDPMIDVSEEINIDENE